MPDLNFEYVAHRFKPRQGADGQLLLFVAPAQDIRAWAGVPRKAFDYQHGFQRTLNPARVTDVVKYFQEDANNVSPTSVVVGFTGAVTIAPVYGGMGAVEAVKISITLPDLTDTPLSDLTDLAIDKLKERLPEATTSEIDANLDSAVATANQLQDEDVVDESLGIQAGNDNSDVNIAPPSQDRSYLADFYAQLRGYRQGLLPWPDEGPLREILYSILKPAIIVDGQHRVFGGAQADENMLFAVCALPASSWAESVYQFVVINQKAKPIKPAFLSSIIATSLSQEEVDAVYDRLRTSNIDVERAETMDAVNTDATSPFKDMIDFEVEGSPGFLQFPGMSRLVREFSNIPRSHAILLPDGAWDDVAGGWLENFYGFWWGVRDYFETADPRLWRKPSGDNPNNLLKIVALQEMQGLMLDNWADSRVIKLAAPDQTRAAAKMFWDGFPATFFTDEWRLKGLQTSVGRQLLRNSMTETRRNTGQKNWGHRRLSLFKA